MPTYEYRCKDCGQDLEVVQEFTDDALTTCEACGGELRKVFGSVGISFKGSGFYKTDSRATSGTGAKADTASADKGSSESSSSGDSAKGGADKTGSDKSSSGTSTPEKSSSAATTSA